VDQRDVKVIKLRVTSIIPRYEMKISL